MKFMLKSLMLAPLLAFALANDEETEAHGLRRNLQVAAKIVTQSSSLGRCEGDCDSDGDCASGLVCHQRDAGDNAPGCSLTTSQRGSKVDFCVSGGSAPSPAASPVRSPPTGGSSSGGFKLKLYWEEGYYWQETRKEAKWCLNCKDGNCRSGGNIVIYDCGSSPTRWQFVSRGQNEVQIKVSNQDYCIEEYPDNELRVARCNSSEQKQRFLANGGSFSDRRFEISPKQRRGWCMTQRHHPKNKEHVNLETCVGARRSDTSYWNKY